MLVFSSNMAASKRFKTSSDIFIHELKTLIVFVRLKQKKHKTDVSKDSLFLGILEKKNHYATSEKQYFYWWFLAYLTFIRILYLNEA